MISHNETYQIGRDGIALLALDADAEQALRLALEGGVDEDRELAAAVEDDINAAITEHIQRYGVDTETGEWFGDWSAREVVSEALARHGVALRPFPA